MDDLVAKLREYAVEPGRYWLDTYALQGASEIEVLRKKNKELEAEWDQLRELGEQYRQLELDLRAKSAMWKTLKTKTPNKPRS